MAARAIEEKKGESGLGERQGEKTHVLAMSPYSLNTNDNPGNIITQVQLKGENYEEWARAMRTSLRAKKKYGFIAGTIQQPAADSAELEEWWTVNSMLVSWILNTIEPTLRSTITYMEMAKDLWDDIKERFAVSNGPRVHQLHAELGNCRQKGLPIVTYYGKLKQVWEELANYDQPPTCQCGGCTCNLHTVFEKKREESKVHQFLMGLDDDAFGTVRSNILSTEPLPTLNRAYAMVIQEERVKQITRNKETGRDIMAFAVRNTTSEGRTLTDGKQSITCSLCHRRGHDAERCFQAIGYPEWWGDRPRSENRNASRARAGRGTSVQGRGRGGIPRANVAVGLTSTSEEPSTRNGFSNEQWTTLLNLMQTNNADTSKSVGPPEQASGKHATRHDLSWILDTGATQHMTCDSALLRETTQLTECAVGLADGRRVQALQTGTVVLTEQLKLHNVLYIPALNCNLISVAQLLTDMDCVIQFRVDSCVIQDRTSRTVIGTGKQRNGLYYIAQQDLVPTVALTATTSHNLWHKRLGHPSPRIVSKLSTVFGQSVSVASNSHICDVCVRAKQTRDVFSLSENNATEKFALIHCDLWGPYKIASLSGASYFLTVVDDCTRSVWVYLLHTKSAVTRVLRNFLAMVERQFQTKVRVVRTDNGTEFTCLTSYFHDQGIVHQTSCRATPQQNGRVERKHRHILNVARALRFQANLPIRFWGECVLTAAYLINRTPTRLLDNKSPYELLYGTSPSYAHLRVFGCLCYGKNINRDKDKFASRSQRCLFLGYPYGKTGWTLYDLTTREVFVSRDVIFSEEVFPFAEAATDRASTHGIAAVDPVDPAAAVPSYGGGTSLPLDDVDAVSPPIDVAPADLAPGDEVADAVPIDDTARVPVIAADPDPADVPASPDPATASGGLTPSAPALTTPSDDGAQMGRGHRTKLPSVKLRDYALHTATTAAPAGTSADRVVSPGTRYPLAKYLCYDKFTLPHRSYLAAVTAGHEPRTYQEAVKHPHWQEAMRKELDALALNGTWTVTSLPPGKRALGSKWVYRIKYHSDGTIERYKARLVILGNHQIEGIDYRETFAPVAKMVSVRCFLAVAAARNWAVHQMDVHNAFLHGDLDEEVYMRPPPGFPTSRPGQVCRLHKSLYGLRQAPRCWFAKLLSALTRYGFIQSRSDYSLFLLRRGHTRLHVLVYVDDLIIAGNDSVSIQHFKVYLGTCFHMKDLGALKYFLGVEVARNADGIFLSQRKYTMDLLSEVGLLGAKPAPFPVVPNHNLALANGALLSDPERYRRLIGRLIYLTFTRPELSYCVHTLAQFMQAPRDDHWTAALRVVRYLKTAPGQGILLRSASDLRLVAYCDSDWASCPLTRRSLTGYFVTLGPSPISWKTKKQHTVSRSSAEAEYRSLATTACELKWLQGLLLDLGVPHSSPIPLFCDSQSALHITANPVFHERTKHIEVDCHFVRDEVQRGTLRPAYIHTTQQLADLFTKALGQRQFAFLLRKLGIYDPHAPP